MTKPRIFVSHSSDDAAFANRLSSDLRDHGADVWLDSSHMAAGDFIVRINEALQHRDIVILVLSPAAIRSTWVTQEFNAAIARSHQGFMQAPLVVVAKPCPLADIPPLWTVYHRYDASHDYPDALSGLVQTLGLAEAAPQNIPASAFAPAAVYPPSPYAPPASAVTYADPLRSNENGWYTDSRISFKNDGLHIRNLKDPSNSTVQSWTAWVPRAKFGNYLGNMVLSVNAKLLRDDSNNGIIICFRSQGDHRHYALKVSSLGIWCFFIPDGLETYALPIPWTDAPAIRKGLNATNVFKVSAVGAHFEFYINDTKVGEAEDSMYFSGEVGLAAAYDAEVVFTDLVIKAW